MRLPRFALAMLLAASCATPGERAAPSTARHDAPPESPAPSATRSPAPTPAPTEATLARVVRATAGVEFALVPHAADLRIETAVSRDDEAAIASAVTADLTAVEREFARPFASRPLIYVFATNESYARGLSGILGYGEATAAFVAENSVSFFEPSLLTILVNWQAIGARRPITGIRHELTHLMTLAACARRCDLVPAWFNEGEARLMETLVPGNEWRQARMRYEAASMAATETLIPLNTLVSQLAWNSLTDWAGYYKYQEAARAAELLREDVGGEAPIARVYERFRAGENLARAYTTLTGRSFDEFVASLRDRMLHGIGSGPSLVTFAPTYEGAGYLLYGFAPSATVELTISGPRTTETSLVTISPFGAAFDAIPWRRAGGSYTLSVQHAGTVLTAGVRKPSPGMVGDPR
jgi:hypothetical protein